MPFLVGKTSVFGDAVSPGSMSRHWVLSYRLALVSNSPAR